MLSCCYAVNINESCALRIIIHLIYRPIILKSMNPPRYLIRCVSWETFLIETDIKGNKKVGCYT